jgi:hypothetical protein
VSYPFSPVSFWYGGVPLDKPRILSDTAEEGNLDLLEVRGEERPSHRNRSLRRGLRPTLPSEGRERGVIAFELLSDDRRQSL